MKILRNFAVLEGCDGSGTTTQLKMLEDFFLLNQKQLSLPPLYKTFEPTDSSIGKIIRAGLCGEIPLQAETGALLFAADQNEHVHSSGGIAERCGRGELVVSDRYTPSSLVYQGITCGDELPARLNRDFPAPELLIFLDIEPLAAQKRMEGRSRRDIYEYLDFQVQVRGRYKAILPRFAEQGVTVVIIDASLPQSEVFAEVWSALRKMPIFKG